MFSKLKKSDGQMTVELAIVFPVLIIVACVMVNALGYAGECASFDRWVRNTVIAKASAPELDKSTDDILSEINVAMDAGTVYSNEDSSATYVSVSDSEIIVECELVWHPTLFGMDVKTEVFGMKLFELTHKCQIKVDPARSGDVF